MKKLSLVIAVCLPLGLLATHAISETMTKIDAPNISTTNENKAVANVAEVDQQAEDAQRFLNITNAMDTFQATFEQLSVSNTRNSMQERSGTLKIKSPGKFAWIITSPYEIYELSNGEKLWKYDVDLEEVDINKVSEKNNQFMRLLQSEETAPLLKEYQIFADRYGDESVFSFIPLSDQLGFSQITISFVNEQLNNIRIQTDLEQATIFDFNDVVINEPIRDSEFELAIPEGVDVYDNTLF